MSDFPDIDQKWKAIRLNPCMGSPAKTTDDENADDDDYDYASFARSLVPQSDLTPTTD